MHGGPILYVEDEKMYQHGANAYPLKPARPEKLAEVLKTINDFWLGLHQLPPDSEKFARAS